MPKSNRTVEGLLSIIDKIANSKTPDEKKFWDHQFIEKTEQAYRTSRSDFVTDLLRRVAEKDDLPEALINDVVLFLECCAAFYDDGKRKYTLCLIPFLASSAFGLAYGQLPEEALNAIYRRLKMALPSSYEISVNADILNAEHFAFAPFTLYTKIGRWAKDAKPGLCRFYPSDETAEEAENLVADIRIIATLISCPRESDFSGFNIPAKAQQTLRRHIASDLRRIFKDHFPATRFEFLLSQSMEFKRYLKKVNFNETILEPFLLPPVLTLTEAGKAFRHFSLREALFNLRQLYNLDIKDLQVAVGAFYESPSIGNLSLMEFRVGISKKGDSHGIVQGVVWPIFYDDPDEVLAILDRSLTWYGFEPDQVRLHSETPYPLSDDEDEDYSFPAFDGKLHEPQPPESNIAETAPGSLRLN